MKCEMCLYYDVRRKACGERHNMPAEGEKCFSFTPQIAVHLNQVKMWAVVENFLHLKELVEDPALTVSSFNSGLAA